MKKSNVTGILKKTLFALAALILLSLAFYRFWFLRQPQRVIPVEPAAFVSPANGLVAAVVAWDTTQLEWQKANGVVQVMTQDIGEKGWLIAIEMNVMNVHYQRAPANSRFLKNIYTEGKFNNALIKTNRFGLRLENERNDLLFETETGVKYKVVQVAGLLARRIEDFLEPGQEVSAGEVIGVIKMGSQVALIVPESVQPLVREGDTVIDGETILARFRSE